MNSLPFRHVVLTVAKLLTAVFITSRTILHSGLNLFHVDAKITGIVTLGQLLRENGDETFGTGKWYNWQASFIHSIEKGRSIMFGDMSDPMKVPLHDLFPDGRVILNGM